MRPFGIKFIMGGFVLLIGTTIAVNVLFGIHFPLLPLALAALLIALGARMMVRTRAGGDAVVQAWLANRVFVPDGERDQRYDILFGRGVVDLTKVPEPDEDKIISIDTIFGATVIKLDPSVPVEITGHSMFGEVRMPDRSTAAMGSIAYKTPSDRAPKLHLRLNTVFGSCQVVGAAA